NQHEGFFIDDIIVGLAGRGEMVTGVNGTGTAGNTSFFAIPQNPSPTANQQALTGPYQLEIRQGTTYGVNVLSTDPNIITTGQPDINDPLTRGFSINTPAGNALTDGQTFTLSDGLKTLTFEFDSNNTLNNANDIRVAFTSADSATKVAQTLRNAIN